MSPETLTQRLDCQSGNGARAVIALISTWFLFSTLLHHTHTHTHPHTHTHTHTHSTSQRWRVCGIAGSCCPAACQSFNHINPENPEAHRHLSIYFSLSLSSSFIHFSSSTITPSSSSLFPFAYHLPASPLSLFLSSSHSLFAPFIQALAAFLYFRCT